MKLREKIAWGLVFFLGFQILFFTILRMEPIGPIGLDRPMIQVHAKGLEMVPLKGQAVMLAQVPPLIDPAQQNITLPPITIQPSPPLPPDVDPGVLANEARAFRVSVSELVVDAFYLKQDDWFMLIEFYAHEEGNNTWVQFHAFNITNISPALWDYTTLNGEHWRADLVHPEIIYVDINLQYVLWKAQADAYPLWIAISITVTGAVGPSCTNVGCDYITSPGWQDAVRVVAP